MKNLLRSRVNFLGRSEDFIDGWSKVVKEKNALQFHESSHGIFHVYDPTTRKHFKIGANEVAWLNLLDGRKTYEELSGLIPDQWRDKFLELVIKLGLVENHVNRKKDLFKIKIQLFNPSKIVGSTHQAQILATAITSLGLFSVIANIVLVLLNYDRILHAAFSFQLNYYVIIYYLVAILLSSFLHELSHVLVARAYGVYVPAIGIMFMYFHPTFYSDITGIQLIQRNQRLHAILAGVLMNSFIASLCGFVYTLNHGYLFLFLMIFNIGIIIINLIPFVDFDGYFALTTILNEPNYKKTSLENISHGILRILFSRPDYVVYFIGSRLFIISLIGLAALEVRKLGLRLVSPAVSTGVVVLLLIALIFYQIVRLRRRTNV